MDTYKNTDVAELFNVSNSTVTRWIELAQQTKNNLQIKQVGNKWRIINNEHNNSLMTKMKDDGIKYRSNINFARVEPHREFYDIFSEGEIVEIINNLQLYRQIPHKYGYFNSGSNIWKHFIEHAERDFSEGFAKPTDEILEENFNVIQKRIGKFASVNLIDLGGRVPSNSVGLAVKLDKLGKLNKFVAVDISPEMLKYSKDYFLKLLPNRAADFVAEQLDIERSDILEQLFALKDDNTVNIIVLFGKIVGNFPNPRRVFNNLRYSLSKDDLLIIDNRLNRKLNKANFDSFYKTMNMCMWIPRLLNIEVNESLLQCYFDEEKQMRVGAFRLDRDYEISIKVMGKTYQISMEKGEHLTVWHHHSTTETELLGDIDYCGMELVHLAKNLQNNIVVYCAQLKA